MAESGQQTVASLAGTDSGASMSVSEIAAQLVKWEREFKRQRVYVAAAPSHKSAYDRARNYAFYWAVQIRKNPEGSPLAAAASEYRRYFLYLGSIEGDKAVARARKAAAEIVGGGALLAAIVILEIATGGLITPVITGALGAVGSGIKYVGSAVGIGGAAKPTKEDLDFTSPPTTMAFTDAPPESVGIKTGSIPKLDFLSGLMPKKSSGSGILDSIIGLGSGLIKTAGSVVSSGPFAKVFGIQGEEATSTATIPPAVIYGGLALAGLLVLLLFVKIIGG